MPKNHLSNKKVTLPAKVANLSRMLIILFALTICLNKPALAQNIAPGIIHITIATQPTDKALIQLAQQAGQTILFSYDLTSQFTSQEINGYFTISLALRKLLKNTNLVAEINNKGQWSIHPKVVLTKNNQISVNKKVKDEQPHIEKIAIVGSHITGRTLSELPVPVDIITGEALRESGHTTLGNMLQTLAPSFNFSRSAISDGSDVLQPATLRGLGPDQTLILVNGKRRHQASLIHINSSVGRGTAGTDMNTIPINAIKRIEILRDGAAAQYGSDAIAGVINIVLNDTDAQASVATSFGSYQQGDGEHSQLSYTHGMKLSDNGFVNATLSLIDHQSTNRSGLHGACQFDQCVELSNGHLQTNDPRELSASRNTFRIGDASYEQFAFIANSELEINNGQLYGFVSYSQRKNQSAAFFRHNANTNENPILADNSAIISQGYLPKINSDINDIAYNLGYRTSFDNETAVDISYTYGKNDINYTTSDSINASYANFLHLGEKLSVDKIREQTPRSAFAYGLSLSLETLNLVFNKEYQQYTLALGAEFRTDTYKIIPGEEYSYQDYDTQKNLPLFNYDAAGGIQGFPGVSPELAVNEDRDVVSFFAETITRINDQLALTAAIRFDDYEIFGNSSNIKVAAHWQASDNLIIRSSYSTGFRAPSMQQMYFNNISTQFIVDETGSLLSEEVETFRNDSTLTTSLGVPNLKEEESDNLSLGFAYTPNNAIEVSVDYYLINIEDRIVISSKLGKGVSPLLDQVLSAEMATKGQFFLNGADTKTQGIDFVTTWRTQVLSGSLNLTLAANFTDTQVVDLFTPNHSTLHTIPVEKIFSEQDISIIEEWQPAEKISLSSHYKNQRWMVNLLFNHYGEYTITDGGRQTFGSEVLTDINITYQVSEKLSLTLGSNNFFNVMPDENTIGNSRGGTIEDEQGNIIVDSKGVFKYSRRSAPFGFNGAYYYGSLQYSF